MIVVFGLGPLDLDFFAVILEGKTSTEEFGLRHISGVGRSLVNFALSF